MKNYDSRIPSHVLARAKQIGKEQGFLPLSPFSVDADSQVALCAAACLAYAGWETRSEHAARKFLSDLVADSSDTVLYGAFEQLNWPRNLCEFVRIENDATPRELRLSTFVSTCSALERSLASHRRGSVQLKYLVTC